MKGYSIDQTYTYNNIGGTTGTKSSSIVFSPYNLDKDSSSIGYSGNSNASAFFIGQSSSLVLPKTNIFYEHGPQTYIFNLTNAIRTDTTWHGYAWAMYNEIMAYNQPYGASIIQSNNSQLISTVSTTLGTQFLILNLKPNTEYDIYIKNYINSSCPSVPISGTYKYLTPYTNPIGYGNVYMFYQDVDYGKGGGGFGNTQSIMSNNSNFTSASSFNGLQGYFPLFQTAAPVGGVLNSPRPYSDQKGKFLSVHSESQMNVGGQTNIPIYLYRYEFIDNNFVGQSNWTNSGNMLQSMKQVALINNAQLGYTNKGMGWVFTTSSTNNILAGAGNTAQLSTNGGGSFTPYTFTNGHYSAGNQMGASVIITGFTNGNSLNYFGNWLMSSLGIAYAVTNNFGQSWTEYTFTASAAGQGPSLYVYSVSPMITLNNKYFIYYYAYSSSNVGIGYIYSASSNSLSGPWTSKVAFNSSAYMKDSGQTQNSLMLERSLTFNSSAVCLSKPYAGEYIDRGGFVDTYNQNILWTSTDGWTWASATFAATNSGLSDGPRWSPSSSLWFYIDINKASYTASTYYSSDVTKPLSQWIYGSSATIYNNPAWARMFIA